MGKDPKELLKQTQSFVAAKSAQAKEKTQEINAKSNDALGTQRGFIFFFLLVPLVGALLAISVHGSFILLTFASLVYGAWLAGR